MPRTKQRTPELRTRVPAAAADLLAEEGVAGLTARSLAARADTSAPALYELFGDKSGVVRELYFEGFRQLSGELAASAESSDPLADLWTLWPRCTAGSSGPIASWPRSCSRGRSRISRRARTSSPRRARSRSSIVGRVRRCIEAGRLRGDETDVAQVLVALIQGMAFAEAAGRLGTSTESVERRWRLAIGAALNGFGGRARVRRWRRASGRRTP